MPNYPENSRQQPMFTRHPFGEPKWQLQSQSEFDGLAPSQIVRYLNAGDRGFEDSEVQGKLAARLDATPDADNYVTNPAVEGEAKGVTVDAHRYVVDPIVDNDHHKYVGLYTGGPVRTTNEPSREGGFHKRCTQVLTRTFCAGHGYWVDEAGRYHAAWPDGNGGWTGRNPDVKQVVFKRPSEAASEDSDAPPEGAVIREYMTADDALKAHRPWLDSKLSPYMALHPEAFPNTFVREVYWREFTHESIAALEELGSDRARLEAVVAYHFTEKVAPQVLDAHCRLDPQTNTVIFVCSLMYVELGEPKSPDDLLDLPFYGERCTRETLRMFGWNQLRDGEGYRYTHIFKWPRLKDTPEVRSVLEFVRDNKEVEAAYKKDEQGNYVLDGSENRILLHPAAESWILALLAKHDQDEHPGWAAYETVYGVSVKSGDPSGESGSGHTEEADNTGRLVTQVDTPEGVERTTPTPYLDLSDVQFYRIAQQQVQVEQDGSLSFSIALARTEWHGADDGQDYEDGGQRQLATRSNPDGWGKAETRVIPSVPRENAIPTMVGIVAGEGEVISSLRQTEGEGGHSDVSFEKKRVWTYTSDDYPPNTQTLDGFKATEIAKSNYPRTSYRLTFRNVKASEVPALISRESKKMGGKPSVSQRQNPDGSYDVVISGRSIEPQHIDEMIVSADWFKHQTREEWLGAVVQTVSGLGTGFYKAYQRDANGMFSIYASGANAGYPIPASFGSDNFVTISGMRGDLDADWMASDPQTPTSGVTGVVHTTMENGPVSSGGVTPAHGDDHSPISGAGWTSGTWADPDKQNDTDDKTRSHVLTSVSVRINEDDSRDYTIMRTYPHQRRWEWKTTEENKDGDQRDIFHVTYRNWPSRKAIQNDLFDNFLSGKDADADDGWGLAGSVTVNEFGLVDAGPITFKPNWDDESHAKHKTIQPRGPFYEDLVKYDYSYRKPEGASGDEKTMRWKQTVHLLRVTGLATSRDDAEDWYKGYWSAENTQTNPPADWNGHNKPWEKAGDRHQTAGQVDTTMSAGDISAGKGKQAKYYSNKNGSKAKAGPDDATVDDGNYEVVGGYGIRFAGYHYGANNEWYEIDVTFVVGRDEWEPDGGGGNAGGANAGGGN